MFYLIVCIEKIKHKYKLFNYLFLDKFQFKASIYLIKVINILCLMQSFMTKNLLNNNIADNFLTVTN